MEIRGAKMASLLIAKNYGDFVSYTYQPVVKMAGGKEKMVKLIQKSFDDMGKQGMSVTNCSIGKPGKIVRAKGELQCPINEIIEMTIPNGKNWTFLDTHNKDLKTLQVTIPNLSNQLVIPAPKEPEVIKE